MRQLKRRDRMAKKAKPVSFCYTDHNTGKQDHMNAHIETSECAQQVTEPVDEAVAALVAQREREEVEAEVDFQRLRIEGLAESIYVALIGNKGTTFSAYDLVNKAFHAAEVFMEEAEKRRK